MKPTYILAATLALGTLASTVAFASDRSCDVKLDGPALSVGQVADRVTAQGYSDIRKIERDRTCFEVRASDAQGRPVELTIHPVTGDVLDTAKGRHRSDMREGRMHRG